MSKINDGGPAFPVWKLNVYGQPDMTGFGMTLRDIFAAKAMQGEIAATVGGTQPAPEVVAEYAYKVADAMLKAREVSHDNQ